MTKNDIRRLMINRRNAAALPDLKEKGRVISVRIMETDFWKRADEIWLYISKEREVDTSFLVRAALLEGRPVAAPRVSGADMDFFYINGPEDLSPGAFGLLEPGIHCGKALNRRASILVPGLAFDLSKNRIGWGGGYYDRYLAAHPGHSTCAPAYDFSVLAAIPAEGQDIHPDMIITERRFIC